MLHIHKHNVFQNSLQSDLNFTQKICTEHLISVSDQLFDQYLTLSSQFIHKLNISVETKANFASRKSMLVRNKKKLVVVLSRFIQ